MRKTEWQRAMRSVLLPQADWGFAGNLAYRKDFGHIAYGFTAKPSSYDGKFDLYAVTLPLFPPLRVVGGEFSRVINSGLPLGPTCEEVPGLVAPLLQQQSDQTADLNRIVQMAMEIPSFSIAETAAYACILLGKVDAAGPLLSHTLSVPDDRDFVLRMKARAQAIADKIAADRIADAVQAIVGYEHETIRNLGLQR